MTIEKIDPQSEELVLSDHIFELPSVGEVDEQYKAIMQFQNAVRTNLKEGLQRDYGTIPGTNKPTLLKPGAEKIMRLARVACEYTIINQVEDWDRPLFSYTVKCHVRIGAGDLLSKRDSVKPIPLKPRTQTRMRSPSRTRS